MKKTSNLLDEIGTAVIGGVLDAVRTLLITGPVAILAIGAALYLFAAYWKLVVAVVALVLLVVAALFWYAGRKLKPYRRPGVKALNRIDVGTPAAGHREPGVGSKTESRPIDLVGSEARSNERRAKREAELAAASHVGMANSRLAPFYYLPAVRPSAGRELFAYTEAWLTLAGLFEGGSIRKALASEVAGGTAISYHLKLANFSSISERGDVISLTDKGVAFFKARRSVGHKSYAAPADVKSWIEFFTLGTGPKAASVKKGGDESETRVGVHVS